VNKRRRFKAKARRAERVFWDLMRTRPATFRWWRASAEHRLPHVNAAEATAALNAAMLDVYQRCSRPDPSAPVIGTIIRRTG
jgi:hypothetical protein